MLYGLPEHIVLYSTVPIPNYKVSSMERAFTNSANQEPRFCCQDTVPTYICRYLTYKSMIYLQDPCSHPKQTMLLLAGELNESDDVTLKFE